MYIGEDNEEEEGGWEDWEEGRGSVDKHYMGKPPDSPPIIVPHICQEAPARLLILAVMVG